MNTPTITHLDHGAHETREHGVCFIEAAAYLGGERHSDRPTCVSRTIAAFGRRWDVDLPDVDRDRLLLPLLGDVVGTGPLTGAHEVELQRAVADWFMRVWAPAWLDLIPDARGFAEQLRAGKRMPKKSVNALSGAYDAAGNAAWGAAGNAAGNAAGSAAWNAAGNAAGSAAGSAAWKAAWKTAESAAWDAAELAALRHGPGVLAPVVEILQTSAVEMIRGLCAQAKEMKNV